MLGGTLLQQRAAVAASAASKRYYCCCTAAAAAAATAAARTTVATRRWGPTGGPLGVTMEGTGCLLLVRERAVLGAARPFSAATEGESPPPKEKKQRLRPSSDPHIEQTEAAPATHGKTTPAGAERQQQQQKTKTPNTKKHQQQQQLEEQQKQKGAAAESASRPQNRPKPKKGTCSQETLHPAAAEAVAPAPEAADSATAEAAAPGSGAAEPAASAQRVGRGRPRRAGSVYEAFPSMKASAAEASLVDALGRFKEAVKAANIASGCLAWSSYEGWPPRSRIILGDQYSKFGPLGRELFLFNRREETGRRRVPSLAFCCSKRCVLLLDEEEFEALMNQINWIKHQLAETKKLL